MARFDTAEHLRWLSHHMQQVLEYGQRAFLPGGFGYIYADGTTDRTSPVELDLTARSTYIYALGTLLGIPGSARRCDHGLRALQYTFKDPEYDGWFSLVEPMTEKAVKARTPGKPVGPEEKHKSSRSMSYLLEAAAAATIAQRPGAKELMEQAIAVEEKYFWDETIGRVNDSFNRDFSAMENYHGMSSNLHAASAFLTAADATKNSEWIRRAARITEFVIEEARKNNWRIPEHFDVEWQEDKEYHVGTPADPRRPYGINVGHCFGWSRKIIQVATAMQELGEPFPEDSFEVAKNIFNRMAEDAWKQDGHPGFFFTVDYQGKPLMRQSFAWVASEAIQALTALGFAMAERGVSMDEIGYYMSYYNEWWDYLEGYVIQPDGYWVGELNPNNQPDDTVWPGAPDIYHSVRVLLAPRLPNTPSKPLAIASGCLDHPVDHEHHIHIWV
ncbi:AGE family epimerase/isomerase [Mobiluncus mulieris]|uniref:AGE family epimerase/isomerase n=1 Tax=Mobiluncus mulieris TaxID=2052 RepID=UPI002431E1A2|nr:AGE family epimerase/isomerase [Mobiluncus mulieris]